MSISKNIWQKKMDLTATLDGEMAYRDAKFVIIAIRTNYDSKRIFSIILHSPIHLRVSWCWVKWINMKIIGKSQSSSLQLVMSESEKK